MTWMIEYYSEKVRLAVDDWPLGIRAFYARNHRTDEDSWTQSGNAHDPFLVRGAIRDSGNRPGRNRTRLFLYSQGAKNHYPSCLS
jgi:hypothetical protein